MRSAKKKWVVISLFAAVLFVTWGIYVLRFNKYYHDLDEVPAAGLFDQVSLQLLMTIIVPVRIMTATVSGSMIMKS